MRLRLPTISIAILITGGMIAGPNNLQAGDDPADVIQQTLRAIYKDIASIKTNYPALRNLSAKSVGKDQFLYENGSREPDTSKPSIGKEVPYKYSSDYCRIDVRVDYPSDFKPIRMEMAVGVPTLFGEVHGKPLAVWVGIAAAGQEDLTAAFQDIINSQLTKMQARLPTFKPLKVIRIAP
jgi:hypothetical protein